MSRTPVHVRDATPDDASALLEIWSGLARTCDRESVAPQAEAAAAVARCAAESDRRMVVAVLEDQVVGAAQLLRAPISPIHSEMAVHVVHLQVREKWRRHGVGRALMEAAVCWAEEKDTVHVMAAASGASRDANRFMARLALAPVATVRVVPTSLLRSRVTPPVAGGGRSVPRVLAARRSQRRS
ncbi:MAG: GNAT family N-acetyltransferase, partial [Nocardioidaceae bacterium]